VITTDRISRALRDAVVRMWAGLPHDLQSRLFNKVVSESEDMKTGLSFAAKRRQPRKRSAARTSVAGQEETTPEDMRSGSPHHRKIPSLLTRLSRARWVLSLRSPPPRIDEQPHQTGITFGVHGCRIVWRDLRNDFVAGQSR
jgi:hypothetical protein